MAVAVDVVDAADCRPELGLARPGRREGRQLARVGAVPRVGADDGRGVRRVLERVVGPVELARGHLRHLAVDRDQGVAEPVELDLRFALGRLDHERAGHGERHRRRVVAIVHEPLGHIVDLDAVLLPRAEVDNALVGHPAARTPEEDGEGGIQAPGHVIGIEDRGLGRPPEPVRSHQADIHPRDDEQGGRTPGSRSHGAGAGCAGF